MARPPVVVGLSLCRTEIRFAAHVPADGHSTSDAPTHLGVIPHRGASDALSKLFLRLSPDLVRYHWSDAEEVWIGPGAWKADELALLSAPSEQTEVRAAEVQADGPDTVRILRSSRFDEQWSGWIPPAASGPSLIEWTDMDLAARHPLIAARREARRTANRPCGTANRPGGAEQPVLVMHASAHRLSLSQFRGDTLINATMFDVDEPVELAYGLAARMRTLAWLRIAHSEVHLFGEHAALAADSLSVIMSGITPHRGVDLAAGGVVMEDLTEGVGSGPAPRIVPAADLDRFAVAMILASSPMAGGSRAPMEDHTDHIPES